MQGRGAIFFIAFTLVGAAILAALGTWQWNRRAEKLAFIAAIEAAAKGPAKPYATAQLWDRVTITGRFLPNKVAYIRTSRPAPKPGERDSRGRVPVSGFGVWVMQAFEYQNAPKDEHGQTYSVLISRGFLPTPPNGAIPPFETPQGEVSLTGFLRPGEKEALFPPYNDPAKGVYFFRDTAQIAKWLGLVGAQDFSEDVHRSLNSFIDREALPNEAAPPFGVETRDFLKAIPNNHLEYAITWWSLAATNLAVAGFFLASRRRRKDENVAPKTP
jgi:surfeit locus 1 family protein